MDTNDLWSTEHTEETECLADVGQISKDVIGSMCI